jgi:hypothetical protein
VSDRHVTGALRGYRRTTIYLSVAATVVLALLVWGVEIPAICP